MPALLNRIKAEPALVVGFILALIGVLSAFGLHVTDGQSAGIVSLVGAVLALLGAGLTRSQVTPADLVAVKAEDGVFVAGPAAGPPDGTPVEVQRAVPDLA